MRALPVEPRTRYDVVLVDAPPLLPVTAGMLLLCRLPADLPHRHRDRSEGPA